MNAGPLLLLCGNLLFATNGIWVTYAPQSATPMTLAGFRMLIGAIFLILWLKISNKKFSLDGWNKGNIFLYSLGLWGFQICLFQSIRLVGMVVGVTIAIASSPVFTAVLEKLIRRKSPAKIWYISTLIAVVGVGLLNPLNTGATDISLLLFPLGAGFCSAVTLIVGSRLSTSSENSPEAAVTLVALVAFVLFMPFFFVNDVTWVFTTNGFVSIIMLGLVNCAIAYSLVIAGLRRTSASVSASIGLSEPMGAAVIGILFLGEPYTMQTIAGILCVLISVGLLLFGNKNTHTASVENNG